MLPALRCAVLAGENDAALTALDRAIELNPNFALAYGQRGARPGLSQPARRGDRRGRAGDALKPERSDHLYLSIWRWPRAPGRRPLRGGIVVGRSALGSNAGLPALRLKLSLFGHLGRRDEASECLQPPARDLSRTDRHRRDAR